MARAKVAWARLASFILPALVVCILLAAQRYSVLLNHLELKMSPKLEIRNTLPISIITINSDTPEKLGAESNGAILSRSFHARLLERLAKVGPKAVTFDLDFSLGSPGDQEFQQAIEDTSPLRVILGAAPKSAPGNTPSTSDFQYPRVIKGAVPENVSIGAMLAWEPDLILRGARLLQRDSTSSETIPHISLASYLAFKGAAVDDVSVEDNDIRLGDRHWPVLGTGEYRCGWVSRADPFPTYEFADVLRLDTDTLKKDFAGRLVIICSTTDSARNDDMQTTEGGPMLGAAFVANMIESLDQSKQPRDFPKGVNLVICLAMAYVGFLSIRRISLSAGLAVLSMAIALWVSCIFALRYGYRMGISLPMCALGLSALLGAGLSAAEFRRVAPRFAKERWKAGELIRATVMFVDTRGSTQLGTELGDDRFRLFIAENLNSMSQVVVAHGGYVERTMGDGLLAIFRGYPPDLQHIATELQRYAMATRTTFLVNGPVPPLSIGLEYGEILGNLIETAGLTEWSSQGLTLHLASRLQSLCGERGWIAAIGPTLASKTSSNLELMGEIELRGIGKTNVSRITVDPKQSPIEA